MDLLSRLLQLYPVDVVLEMACKLGAPWSLENAETPSGTVPYYIIAAGSVWLHTVKEQPVQLHEGDIVVLPSGQAHTLSAEGTGSNTALRIVHSELLPLIVNEANGKRSEMFCGHFSYDPSIGGILLSSLPALLHVHRVQCADLDEIGLLIKLLRAESHDARLGSSVILRQLASILFAMILRAWIQQAPAQSGMLALLADSRLRRGLQSMLDNPAHPWSLDELAAACHMSRASFARHFVKEAGMTPGDMLMRIRMARAAQLLRTDSRNVVFIAEEVGYQSEAAFNRAFSRFHGSPPGSFRRQA